MELPDLCFDVIFEILSRTSLKTLDLCKSVCKEWKNLTYESWFESLHHQRTDTIISGYFVQNMESNNHLSKFVSSNNQRLRSGDSNLSLDFLPHNVKILGSSKQGILCCVSRRDRHYRYYICKPSTRQLQALPNPKLRYKMDNVALVVLGSTPLRFKVVRFTSHSLCYKELKSYYKYRCEIFDSKIWAWKETEMLLPYGTVFNGVEPVVVGGSIYWLTNDDHVLAFNEDHETHSLFPIPNPMCGNYNYKYKQLVEYQGRLAFVCMSPQLQGCFELWVMEDFTDHVWKRRQLLNIKEREVVHPSVEAFCNTDVALVKEYRSVVFYNFQNCSFNRVNLGQFKNLRQVFPFRSDFEPINLKGTT